MFKKSVMMTKMNLSLSNHHLKRML